MSALIGLWAAAPPAIAQQHSSPLKSTPKRYYPSGANISQNFEAPEASDSTITDASAAPGHVSSAAAMRNLMGTAKNRARVKKELSPVFRSQTRVLLAPTVGLEAPTVASISSGPSIYKFTYGYQYKGVPVWKYSTQSQLIRVKSGSHKTLVVRERNTPKLESLGDNTTINADEAGKATKLGLDDSKDATTVALAVDTKNDPQHPEIHVDARGKSELALAFVVRSTERGRPFARRYWVATAGEPKILAREDLIYHAQDTPAGSTSQGQVTGNYFAYKMSPLDSPAQNQPLNDFLAQVSLGGTPIVADSYGFYSALPGAIANINLSGPYCTIINDAGPLLVATKSGNNLFFNAMTTEELAQVSAFKWVSGAHAFVSEFVKGNDDRLKNLPTHVNIDDSCNAFFDPSEHTLNFFKAGDGCANSAYCDVASHEFGHAVDDQFGEILDGGYSEGFGDSLAILITRDSIIGRDFNGKTNPPLRDAKEVHTWPPPDPEVHEVGRIYGGFTWELVQRLIAKLGSDEKGYNAAKQLVLGAAALNPKDTPDAVRLSFLVDRQNGSPYFDELAAAADSRRIPRPASASELDSPANLTATAHR